MGFLTDGLSLFFIRVKRGRGCRLSVSYIYKV